MELRLRLAAFNCCDEELGDSDMTDGGKLRARSRERGGENEAEFKVC